MSKWKTVKLGEVCIINPKDVIDNDEMQVSFIPMQKVSESGDIDASEIRIAKEVMKGCTSFAEDDVLMAKITPCMENGKGAIARGLFNKRGFGSTELFVIRPNTSVVCSEWVYYYTTQKNFRINCERNMTGSAGQKHVSKNYLEKCLLPLPPLSTQKQIAANLDKATQTIDLCNAILEKLDLLVKARFVEMFGDIYTNNHNYLICYLADFIDFLTSGSRGWAQYCVDDGSEWFITIKNVKDCRITTDNIQPVNAPDNMEAKRTKVKEGDLLISITADLGRTGVVTQEIADHGAYINQHLTCIRLDRTKLNPLYVAFFMESASGKPQFEAKNQTGVKAGLNFDSIKSLKLLVPPLELQNQIAAFVEKPIAPKPP